MEVLLGAGVSVLIQLLKKIYKKFIGEDWQDIMILLTLVVVSFLVALLVYYLKSVNAWEAFYTILTTAGAVWAFIFRQLEK